MKRFFALLLTVCAFSGLMLLIGCGDDDNGTDSNLVIGDTTDVQFQEVRDALLGEEGDGIDGFSLMMMSLAFEVADTVINHPDYPNAPRRFLPDMQLGSLQGDSVLLTYHANSQYWYFYTHSISGVDTSFIIDSIQFLHATGPVQWPDSALVTGIRNGLNVVMNTPVNAFSWVVNQDITMMGDLPGYGDVEIDGSQTVDVGFQESDTTDTCTVLFDMSTTFTDLLMNLEVMDYGGCPTGGTIVHSGDINLSCTSGDSSYAYNDFWNVTEVFSGTLITVTFENSTTRWMYTDTCMPPTVRSGGPFDVREYFQ